MFAESPEIQIARTHADFPRTSECTSENTTGGNADTEWPHTAAIAFGSNLGDRFRNVDEAFRALEKDPLTVKVVDTSFLYETDAMYVEDQRRFLNGACLVWCSNNSGFRKLIWVHNAYRRISFD